MRIVVDAMGGDYAPGVVVEGACAAVKEYDVEVILVGQRPVVEPLLATHGGGQGRISVHHAPEVIEMHEPATVSVRKKRNSSITVGLQLVKEGKGDAFFSAGNTGAVVCAATLTLGLVKGVERPGIAIVMPSLSGISLLIDAGANIDPKPTQLLQYAVMAQAYARFILNRPEPKVGLLNIGEEEGKGTEFLKETHELLAQRLEHFIGNVEGKDLFSGKCDVIVCDGFVGNVALKVSESLAEAMYVFLKRHLKSNPLGFLGFFLLKSSFRNFKKEIDYSEYGGAPLLGVNGDVIIGHGRSTAKAIKNAIRAAKAEVERSFTDTILETISAHTQGAPAP